MPEFPNYPTQGHVVSTRSVHIRDFPHSHEVRVWLPPSYAYTDRMYPTLWIMDNLMEMAVPAMMNAPAGGAPELILISIGSPLRTPAGEYHKRRTYDFSPPHGELSARSRPEYSAEQVGGAVRFRDYLVDELRPMLAGEYRMDPREHGYAGFSGGGTFGIYILFTRPSAFTRYIVGSPGGALDYSRLEAAYAAAHEDLQVRLFIAAGEAEATDRHYSGAAFLGRVAMIAEALTTRNYPSLEMTLRIFQEHDHMSVLPMFYVEGIRTAWGDLLSPVEG